jgi:hypothetical protein
MNVTRYAYIRAKNICYPSVFNVWYLHLTHKKLYPSQLFQIQSRMYTIMAKCLLKVVLKHISLLSLWMHPVALLTYTI